jgi:hypothetical protein
VCSVAATVKRRLAAATTRSFFCSRAWASVLGKSLLSNFMTSTGGPARSSFAVRGRCTTGGRCLWMSVRRSHPICAWIVPHAKRVECLFA